MSDSHDSFWRSLADERSLEANASDPSLVEFGAGSSLDGFLGGSVLDGGRARAVRELIQSSQTEMSFPLKAGTRVSFSETPGALLSYKDSPMPGSEGTVVLVRSGSIGDLTGYNGQTFVLWDDKVFRSIHKDHLHLAHSDIRLSSGYSVRVASLGDIGGFMHNADNPGDLVHRATKDLWSLSKDSSGYLLERLFDETGDPLKV